MHLQDLFGTMLLIGLVTIVTSLFGKPKKRAWAKSGPQVGCVISVVAFISFGYAPIKPKTPEQIARDAKAAAELQSRLAQQTAEDNAKKIRDDLEDKRQTEKAVATVLCGRAIQQHLMYPGSYSETWFSSSNQQFETSDGWEIFKAFEAKNGFGGSLPHVGHCSLKRGGGITVEIGRG